MKSWGNTSIHRVPRARYASAGDWDGMVQDVGGNLGGGIREPKKDSLKE